MTWPAGRLTAAASPAGTLGTVTITYDQAAMLDWYAFGPGPNDVPAGSPMGKDQVTMSFGPTPAGALQSMAGLLRLRYARDRLSGRGQPCLDMKRSRGAPPLAPRPHRFGVTRYCAKQ
jgi:hypothetical protein